MTEILVISFLILVIVVLGVGVYNLIKSTEKLEDLIEIQNSFLINISKIIRASDEHLKLLDSKGIFQADDEVGTFFQAMKDVQEELNKYVLQLKDEEK